MGTDLPRIDRMRLEISAGLAIFASSTRVITSPALIPARSAGDPLATARTSTPSCTPKYCASCPSSVSHSIPSAELRHAMKLRGTSGIRISSRPIGAGGARGRDQEWCDRVPHADFHHYRLRRATSHDLELHVAARRRFAHQPRELFHAFHALPVVLKDRVAVFQPGLFGGTIGLHARDLDAGLFV